MAGRKVLRLPLLCYAVLGGWPRASIEPQRRFALKRERGGRRDGTVKGGAERCRRSSARGRLPRERK